MRPFSTQVSRGQKGKLTPRTNMVMAFWDLASCYIDAGQLGHERRKTHGSQVLRVTSNKLLNEVT